MKASEARKITKANTQKREIDYLVDKSLERIYSQVLEVATEGLAEIKNVFLEEENYYSGYILKELEKAGYKADYDSETNNYLLSWHK